MEAFQESVNLLLHNEVHLVAPKFLQVLDLILIGHSHRRSILNQVLRLDPSEVVSINRESESKLGDVLIHRPHTTAMELIVQIFEVLEHKVITDHHLVHWFAEVDL